MRPGCGRRQPDSGSPAPACRSAWALSGPGAGLRDPGCGTGRGPPGRGHGSLRPSPTLRGVPPRGAARPAQLFPGRALLTRPREALAGAGLAGHDAPLFSKLTGRQGVGGAAMNLGSVFIGASLSEFHFGKTLFGAFQTPLSWPRDDDKCKTLKKKKKGTCSQVRNRARRAAPGPRPLLTRPWTAFRLHGLRGRTRTHQGPPTLLSLSPCPESLGALRPRVTALPLASERA